MRGMAIKTRKPRIEHENVKIKGTVAHRHKKSYHRKSYLLHTRDGKVVRIPPTTVHIRKKTYPVRSHVEKREELKYGGHFNEVAEKIAKEYESKGYSHADAERIGKDTAADIYRAKLAKSYGK